MIKNNKGSEYSGHKFSLKNRQYNKSKKGYKLTSTLLVGLVLIPENISIPV